MELVWLLVFIVIVFIIIGTVESPQRNTGNYSWCRALGVGPDGIPLWRKNPKMVNIMDGPDSRKIADATYGLKEGEKKTLTVKGCDGKIHKITIEHARNYYNRKRFGGT